MEQAQVPENPCPDRSAGPGSKILFALRGAGAVPEILHCKAGQVVEEWILSGTGALWVQGAPGSGCTTLVAGAIHRALSGANGRFLGALRIEGRPGSRMEEALSEINEFLRQLGIHDLDEVLDQRTSLTAKISILLTVLCRHCVVLWFDDFEHLSASGGADAGLPLRYFAQGWAEIPSGAGKVIVVTENGGPDGLLLETTGAQRMSVQETGGVAVEELLGHLEKSVPLGRREPGTSPPRGSLLEVKFRHLFLASRDHPLDPEAARKIDAASLPEIVSEAENGLSPEARGLLDVAAVYRAPLGRGALRALGRLEAEEAAEAAAAEICRAGLAECIDEDGSRFLRIHPVLAAIVEDRLRDVDPDGWKELQKRVALHLIEAGNRSGSLWHLVHCRQRLQAAGLPLEAYEVQKTFLEELLRRGLNELARSLLLESAASTQGPARAVSLGNLAIIQKNEGDLDEAIRLYGEIRTEFELMNDLPNLARVYHQIGNTHYLKGDLDQALESYQKSLDISLTLDERTVSTATRVQIANVHFVRGDHEEALKSYQETLELAQQAQDKTLTTAIHLQIAQLLLSLKRIGDAEEELQVAHKGAKALGDRRNLIKVDQLLALVAADRRDYDQALAHLRQAAEAAGTLGDPLELASCYLRIGILEAERLQFTKAVESMLKALDLAEAGLDRAQAAGASGDLGTYRSAILEKLQEVAAQVGPEVYARILRNLGREK